MSDNRTYKSFYKCKSKICKLEPNFVTSDKVISTPRKRMFDCVVPNWTTYIDCNSSNVIYLFTCDRCFLQYVGETFQKLDKIFNWHKIRFKQFGKGRLCRILSDNFHKDVCCNASYLVQMGKAKGKGKTAKNTLDASITSRRKQHEKTWMLKLPCSSDCV